MVTNALARLIAGDASPGRWRARTAGRGGLISPGSGSEGNSSAVAQRRRILAAQDPASATDGTHGSHDHRATLASRVPHNPLSASIDLAFCPWLNASTCSVSVRLSTAGAGILVAAYNPLAW